MEKQLSFVAIGHLYPAEVARKRLGLGTWAWRSWRRAGLRVRHINGRAFVAGDDIISSVCNQPSDGLRARDDVEQD